jgi:hypothetical protein
MRNIFLHKNQSQEIWNDLTVMSTGFTLFWFVEDHILAFAWLIYLQETSHIPTSVAVIWSRPDSHYIFVSEQLFVSGLY